MVFCWMNHASLSAGCTSIPGRYARALFVVAQKEGSLERTLEECEMAAQVLARGSSLRFPFVRMLQGKWRAEAIAGLEKAVQFQPFFVRFLQVLAVNCRISRVSDVVRIFRLLVDDALNRVSVRVCARDALTPAQQKRLEEQLRMLFGREVCATYTIEPALLGGLVIKSLSVTIDASVRHQIAAFTKNAQNVLDGEENENKSR